MNSPRQWQNWARNITFDPATALYPRSADEIATVVARASTEGKTVRPVGTSHSSTPLALTSDININLDQMAGIVDVDTARRRIRLLPGTRVNAIGPAIWEHGLCLKNQGDIDAQQFAGAISTGTHGSGKHLQSFSGSLRRVTAVTGTGDIRVIDEADAEPLAAAQVGLGLTGIYTELELEVRDAFYIHESIRYWSLPELLEKWDEYFEQRLHFSFFWMPATQSPSIFNMPVPEGEDIADRTYVKIYAEVPLESGDHLSAFKELPQDRVDRPYRIYPEAGTDIFHELEYMVPFERGKEAFSAVRDLVYTAYPTNIHPIEVRSVAADNAHLSPQYRRDNIVIAVHCDHLDNGEPFLRAVSKLLEDFNARPHWAKLAYTSPEYLERVFPAIDRFRRVRRALDPGGVFLNEYLRPLFA